jgi:hypothetical protein
MVDMTDGANVHVRLGALKLLLCHLDLTLLLTDSGLSAILNITNLIAASQTNYQKACQAVASTKTPAVLGWGQICVWS